MDAKSQTRFVLEDETKLKIKLRIEEEKERLLKDTIPFTIEYLIKFINYNEPRYCINHGSGKVELIFDIDWLTKNLDYATILNNFIHLFEYVDWNGRLAFISHSHDKKGLELALGMKNISDYDVSFAFQSKQLEVLSIMYAYYKFLEQHDIQLEKVVQWFLQEYLPNEFNIDGFKFHVPIESSSTLDKIRFLLPEMESILKQFDSYTKYKKVNWELLEISSNPLSVKNIGSILNDKYIEINPEDKLCSNEMNWLFSDQSTLTFLDNSTKTWKESTAFLLFMNHSVALKDYKHRLQDVINWLISRNDLKINDKGFICLTARAMVLKLLYEGDVLNTYYYKDKKSVEQLHSVIQEMIKENEVIPYSSLLSRPEQDYFNYMLNEHTFGNGPKLRNKYIHASSKIDDKIQEQDYMYLLIILIGIIIKMNEEFCLYYPNSKESAIIWC